MCTSKPVLYRNQGSSLTIVGRFDLISKVVDIPDLMYKAKLILQDNVTVETALNPWPVTNGCLVVYSCCSLGASASTNPTLSPSSSSSSLSSSTTKSESIKDIRDLLNLRLCTIQRHLKQQSKFSRQSARKIPKKDETHSGRKQM